MAKEQLYPLIAAGVSAAAKGITAASQRKNAKKLKESNFIPQELAMNKDLARLQAMSGRAPGQAKAEENVRRGQANTLSNIRRSAGGDTGKLAAASIASQVASQEALDNINVRGQEYADRAQDRVMNANNAIAGQKARNRSEFNEAKIDLLRASDENYMKAFNDLLEGAMASAYMSGGSGKTSTGSATTPSAGAGTAADNAIRYSSQGRFPVYDEYGRVINSRMRNPWLNQ